MKECHKCKSPQKIKTAFEDIIFFNVESLKQDIFSIGISNPISISDIPSEIKLLDYEYKLKGVVEYIEARNNETGEKSGHYVVHCKNEDNKFYQFNNLSPNIYITPGTTLLLPTILMYAK